MGVPIIYDKDLPQVPAIAVAENGSCNQVQMYGLRVELTPFETICRVRIPYAELYQRRFRALDRAKDRLIEGMQLREDLIIFSALATASAVSNTAVTVTGALSRDGLAKAVAQIEQNRLVAGSILMTAFGTMGIRRFQYQELDQVGMQMVRESGYLGSIWGIDFYVTDQLANGQLYVMATPKFNAWLALRKEADIIPAENLACALVTMHIMTQLIRLTSQEIETIPSQAPEQISSVEGVETKDCKSDLTV